MEGTYFCSRRRPLDGVFVAIFTPSPCSNDISAAGGGQYLGLRPHQLIPWIAGDQVKFLGRRYREKRLTSGISEQEEENGMIFPTTGRTA
jgi:hypothetical protein